MTKPDLKGKTIEIQGKRYLVMSCAFRQPSDRDAAGWAMLLVNERGLLDQHMVGIDGPIMVVDGPRPITVGSFADLAHRSEVKSMVAAGAVDVAIKGITFAQSLTPPIDSAAARDGFSPAPADVARRRVQRDPSKPVTEITWSEYPPQMARSVAARAGMDEQVAKMHPIALSPEVAAAITDAPKVVQNAPLVDRDQLVRASAELAAKVAPLEVDRNRFLGSVPIGKDGNCACRPVDTCPVGKHGGSENRCTFDELTAAGHNWHHDKPGTDDGATVGTTEIPSTFDERVPDARILQIWEAAHHGHNAIGHPVELQAICEEVNSHRRAATAHHNSKHMQALREHLNDYRRELDLTVTELSRAKKAHEQARVDLEHEMAIARGRLTEIETLRETVNRLEHEIALVTKCPTVMPQLPGNTREDDGVLVFAAVPIGADRAVTDPVRLTQWARKLVAERNHARMTAIALQRRIDAMARTMGPPLSSTTGSTLVAIRTGPADGDGLIIESRWPDNVEPPRDDSPYKRD